MHDLLRLTHANNLRRLLSLAKRQALFGPQALCLLAATMMVSSGSQGLGASAASAGGHEGHGAGHAAEAGLPRSQSPEGATVYFITPIDGQKTSSPVVVRFGLGGMGVAPAGVAKGDTGHHHLVIDAELPKLGLPVPKSANYRHFGNGQTEVSLSLKPGTHTLQLLLGDHLHIPHDPAVHSKQITITVTEAAD